MGQPAERMNKTAESSATRQPAFPPRLVSLAILKENYNQGRSYLDNFIPFVAECLRSASGPVTASAVQKSLRKIFGMQVPQQVVEALLRRAVRDGLATSSAGSYQPNLEKLDGRILTPKRQELIQCYETLIAQMRTFAAERYERVLTDQEASSALDAYVTEFGATTLLRGVADLPPEPRVVADAEVLYVVHAFVEHLALTNLSSFRYFQTIVEGSMLTSLVYLPDPGAVQRKFADSTVYLDTPFMLRALGYLGDELEAPALELLRLLVDGLARLACFDATLAELRGVILSATPPSGRSGSVPTNEVSRQFLLQGFKKADVELEAAQLDGALARMGIRVVPAPGYTIELGVDERRFEEVLSRHVHYARDATLRHDLDALTAVHRLRRGQRASIMEDSKAIFVTTNGKLTAASREFFRTEEDGHSWPHAMLDGELATLMWLKTPLEAPDLPRKQIMADCYAALRPSDAMWNRYLTEIERTAERGDFTDKQLDIMRYSIPAQRALMDTTFGEEAAIDDQVVRQVLASAEAAITAPVKAELEEERARRTAAEEEAVGQEQVAAAATLAAEQATTVALAADKQARHGRLLDSAEHRAKRVGRSLFISLAVVLAASVALSVIAALVPALNSVLWLRIPAGILVVVAGLATIAGSGWGWNARDFAVRVEKRLAPFLHRRSLRRLGEEAE